MSDILKLREERKGIMEKRLNAVGQMEKILSDSGDASLTGVQSAEFKRLDDEVKAFDAGLKAFDAKIDALATVEAYKAKNLTPAERDPIITVSAPNETKGAVVPKIIRSLCAAKGSVALAMTVAEKMYGDTHPVTKALASGIGSSGGFLVPAEHSNEVIELLRARTVIRPNAVIMPMRSTLMVARQSTSTAAGYVGENNAVAKSTPTFGQIVLTSKKLAALVPVSNDLLRNASPAADDLISADMAAAMGVTEDSTFIRGVGSASAPKGLRYWLSADNITSSAGTSLANIETDLKACIGDLVNHDVRMIKPVWLMAPRSRIHLEFLRDSNGNLAFPEVSRGMLKGYPIAETNNIPVNLGGGTATEMYLVDMADAIIGEESGIELMASDVAPYVDGNSIVSAFSNDQTVIRAISRHDFCLRHDRSAAVVTGITWGA